MAKPLLNVSNLKTYFYTTRGIVKAVDDVSFDIYKGESIGIVGESGSGKSVTALSIMQLIQPPGKIVDGQINFQGQNIIDLSKSEIQKIRGNKISMSFQDPTTYLNPVHKVGDQIAESILLHENISKSEAREKAIKVMEKVRINDPEERSKDYPHQLSGGMRQRCLLAIALSCNPELLIADEPTTSVDVITQDAILRLIKDIKTEIDSSLILITHDLGIVAGFAEKVIVMYAGNIMEIGEVIKIFRNPSNFYTRALFESTTRLDKPSNELIPIKGLICDPINPPSGCKFHPRCNYSEEICKKKKPVMKEVDSGHFVACHLA